MSSKNKYFPTTGGFFTFEFFSRAVKKFDFDDTFMLNSSKNGYTPQGPEPLRSWENTLFPYFIISVLTKK